MQFELKPQFMVLTAVTFLSSCVSDNKMKDHEYPSSDVLSLDQITDRDTISALSPEQRSAFEALNTLQVSTDQIHHLYSTFAGINQPCYPPDTSFVLSQSDLLIALKHFVNIHCTNLNITKRNELASSAVLAQKEYTLFLCLDRSASISYANGAPMTGTWVLPNILGRRDVIIVW